jgi:hypothetical protein
VAGCRPYLFREVDSTHAVFAVRCGDALYPGWQAVRAPSGLDILAPRTVPGAVRATVPALLVPVLIAWMVAAGAGRWPE